MSSRSYAEDERALTRLAASQGGFFTAKQAASLGYTAPKRSYHVAAGNWVRERRGIFRLATQPLPSRPDLILWWLWSRNRQDEPLGVFSHQTALSLHELTDGMPSRVHITVPPGFRRGGPIPKAIVLHRAELSASHVTQIEGVPVTNALQTLLDVAESKQLPMEDLSSAFEEGVRSGRISRAEIAEAESDPARRKVLRTLHERKRS